MKKTIACILAALMALSLFSCGGETADRPYELMRMCGIVDENTPYSRAYADEYSFEAYNDDEYDDSAEKTVSFEVLGNSYETEYVWSGKVYGRLINHYYKNEECGVNVWVNIATGQIDKLNLALDRMPYTFAPNTEDEYMEILKEVFPVDDDLSLYRHKCITEYVDDTSGQYTESDTFIGYTEKKINSYYSAFYDKSTGLLRYSFSYRPDYSHLQFENVNPEYDKTEYQWMLENLDSIEKEIVNVYLRTDLKENFEIISISEAKGHYFFMMDGVAHLRVSFDVTYNQGGELQNSCREYVIVKYTG